MAFVFIVPLMASCGKRVDPAPKSQAPPTPFEFLNVWRGQGEKAPGKLDGPVAEFAVDVLGNVFLADPAAGFVHKFESKGNTATFL